MLGSASGLDYSLATVQAGNWLADWRATVDKRPREEKANRSHKHALVVMMASSLLGCTNKSIASRSGEMIVPLYLKMVRHVYNTMSSLGPTVQRKALTTQKESSWGPPEYLGLKVLALWEGTEGLGFVHPAEEIAVVGPNSSLLLVSGHTYGEVNKETEPDFTRRVWWDVEIQFTEVRL